MSQSTAASAVAEHLNTPAALARVGVLRHKIDKERQSLLTSLSALAKDQIDSLNDGLERLNQAKDSVEVFKENMKDVQETLTDPRSEIEGFGKLVQASTIHKRILQTLEMVTSLKSMDERLVHVNELLSIEREDPLGPAKNLLVIHYHLSDLEHFRSEILVSAKNKNNDQASASYQTLQSYFNRLTTMIEAFEAHYFDIVSKLLPLVRKGNASVAVKICKIAETEEAKDEKTLAIRLVKNSRNANYAARFQASQAHSRQLKHYKRRLVETIQQSCLDAVDAKFKEAQEEVILFLNSIDWLYGDVELAQAYLSSCFAPDWKIESVFVKGYHSALNTYLEEILKTGPGGPSLLSINEFVKDYRKVLVKELKVTPQWIEPPLLHAREGTVIEDYLDLLRSRLDEWVTRLMRDETADFINRSKPPELSHDGKQYIIQCSSILFDMINQQIDMSLESNQASVVTRVVEEVRNTILREQLEWTGVVTRELEKQKSDPENAPPGLVEYTMALANDLIRSADQTEALLNKLDPMVSDKYRGPIAEALNEAVDGYLEAGKTCVQVLIELVLHDLRPALKTLFTSPWYNDNRSAVQIIETFKDYMIGDYQVHLIPTLFDLLVEDILDAYLVAYLSAMRKANKLKMPKAADRFKEDMQMAKTFFAQFKDKASLQEAFDVIDFLYKILKAPKDDVFFEYWPFKKKYGANVPFVESVLKARDDLSRSVANDILNGINSKVAQDYDTPAVEGPTIFNRLL